VTACNAGIALILGEEKVTNLTKLAHGKQMCMLA